MYIFKVIIFLLALSINTSAQEEQFLSFPSFQNQTFFGNHQQNHRINLADQENPLYQSFEELYNYSINPELEPKQENGELIYDFMRFYTNCKNNQGQCAKLNPDEKAEVLTKCLTVFRSKSGFTKELEQNPFSAPKTLMTQFSDLLSASQELIGYAKIAQQYGSVIYKGATPVGMFLLLTNTISGNYTEAQANNLKLSSPIRIENANPAVLYDLVESLWHLKYAMLIDNLGMINDDFLKEVSFRDRAYQLFSEQLKVYSNHVERLRLSSTGVLLYPQWQAIVVSEFSRFKSIDGPEFLADHSGISNGTSYFINQITKEEKAIDPDIVLSRQAEDVKSIRELVSVNLNNTAKDIKPEEMKSMTTQILMTLYQQGELEKANLSALRAAQSSAKLAQVAASPIYDTLGGVRLGADLIGAIPGMGFLGVRDLMGVLSSTCELAESGIDSTVGKTSQGVYHIADATILAGEKMSQASKSGVKATQDIFSGAMTQASKLKPNFDVFLNVSNFLKDCGIANLSSPKVLNALKKKKFKLPF